MDISAVATNTTSASVNTYRSSLNQRKVDEVKKLEDQKTVLTQKLEDARNPFALNQSDEYKQLQKKLAEKEEELTQARATKRTAQATKVSETSSTGKAQSSSAVEMIKSRNFDTFTHQVQSSPGIYEISLNKDGQRVINFNGFSQTVLQTTL